MGMGFPVLERAIARGLLPSFGCDIVSSGRGDLFTQMRLGLQAERGRRNAEDHAHDAMPAHLDLTVRDALRFATLGGAEALGLGAICGSLEPGKAADVVLVRTDGLHGAPMHDPVAWLVLQAGPGDVDTVIVDGHVVKRGGVLTGADVPALRRLVEDTRDRVAAELAPRGGLLPPEPDGWLDVTLQVMEAHLAGAPGAGEGAGPEQLI
jgi:cytosine/adenosine deaminase-related metal-dependent hydrolase